MVRWVDHISYVGPDRRDRRERLALRLRERRRAEAAGPAPPLSHALRHLRARVHDCVTPEGLQRFRARSEAIASLADARGCIELGELLMRLARDLAYAPDDPRDVIYAELDKAEALAGDA